MRLLFVPDEIDTPVQGMKPGDSLCFAKPLILAFGRRASGSGSGSPGGRTQSIPRLGVSFFEASQFRFKMPALSAIHHG